MPATMSNANYFATEQQNPAPEISADIAQDQQRLREVAARVEQLRSETLKRIASRGRDHAGKLQQSLERDVELNEMASRLRQLDRMGPYACLGFMENASTGERHYIGRIGLSDDRGKQLMLDWRAPAAEPFFAATHENSYGLAMRRRYRWRRQHITDYWDEVFDSSLLASHARLDDHSSFLASLGSQRSSKMQDVLSTIQTDQDAIIRSSSQGALVVDGGPGTGKTVVALHRAAYLLHADPRLRGQGGRVLVVSPHEAYSGYVSDVLPNLGENEVLISTLSNIVSIGEDLPADQDPEVRRIKASTAMLKTIERAITVFQEPPATDQVVELAEGRVIISAQLWRNAVDMIEHQMPHNEARMALRGALIDLLLPEQDSTPGTDALFRAELERSTSLDGILDEYWPVLDPVNLFRALLGNDALLRYSAQELTNEEISRLLANPASDCFTTADYPLIDLARFLIGDPHNEAKQREVRSRRLAERNRWKNVIDDLIASADDKEDLSSQLMHQDLQEQLLSQGMESPERSISFDGPFSHVIIDEAQDLTDAQWAMIQRRCPSGSLTIVGDRAQAAEGFARSWEERLGDIGIRNITVAPLQVNYRSTAQIMEAAAQQILPHMPEANVPRSLRSDGAPVRYARPADLGSILEQWLSENSEGTAVVIGAPGFAAPDRASSLSPEHAKGLEFDLVLVNLPESFGTGLRGAVRRYVAMTRATTQLVVLTEQ